MSVSNKALLAAVIVLLVASVAGVLAHIVFDVDAGETARGLMIGSALYTASYARYHSERNR